MQGPCTPRRSSGSPGAPAEQTGAPAPVHLRPQKARKERRPKSQSAGGASIDKNVAYARSAAPRNPNRRRTGGYIGNKTAIVKARFSLNVCGSHLFRAAAPCLQDRMTFIYWGADLFHWGLYR